MKMTPARLGAVALVAISLSFTGTQSASANDVNVGISFGTPPPPPPSRVYRQWDRPYRTAVWIKPHYDLVRGRWMWVGGYWAYPPRPGMYWSPARYYRGRYYEGYWTR